MRTNNNLPGWHNQPLRLTEEERENPLLVLKVFFDAFHLNDFRNQIWHWLIEVVCSQNSISMEPVERSNHFYLYEKLEALVEACFIIKNLYTESLPGKEEKTEVDNEKETEGTI